MDIEAINNHIKRKLNEEKLRRISAVEAANWLDSAGLLNDSHNRHGQPLRRLLRARLIYNAHQEANRRWYIYRSD